MQTNFITAILAAVMAIPAAAATPLTWDFGTSAPGTANRAAVTSSRHDVTLTATARLFSVDPGLLTSLTQTRSGALIQQTGPGIGVAGGGSASQIDTNHAAKREAILVSASHWIALSGLRLSSVDSNDTLQIFGVAADGTLTSFGLGGVIRSGLKGVRAPLNNLASGVSGSFVQTAEGGTSDLVFTTPPPRFDRFLFTTRVGGDSVYLGALGQGYRLEALSGAVPEPASWALLLLGFGGIGVAARRQRQHQQLGVRVTT